MVFRKDIGRHVFRVIEDDSGWSVLDEARGRSLGRFDQKSEAIEAACIAAEQEDASQVVSHRRDGSVDFQAPAKEDDALEVDPFDVIGEPGDDADADEEGSSPGPSPD